MNDGSRLSAKYKVCDQGLGTPILFWEKVFKLQVTFIMSTFRIIDFYCNNILYSSIVMLRSLSRRERERKRDEIEKEKRGQWIVGRNGGSLNGEQGRTVLDREGTPMAASQWSEMAVCRSTSAYHAEDRLKVYTKTTKETRLLHFVSFWPGGGLNPYLIIITYSKARRGVRGGQFHNKRVW